MYVDLKSTIILRKNVIGRIIKTSLRNTREVVIPIGKKSKLRGSCWLGGTCSLPSYSQVICPGQMIVILL